MDDNPLSQAMAAAVALHEVYTTFVEAGFAPEQALELVKHTLTLSAQPGRKTPPPPPNRNLDSQKES